MSGRPLIHKFWWEFDPKGEVLRNMFILFTVVYAGSMGLALMERSACENMMSFLVMSCSVLNILFRKLDLFTILRTAVSCCQGGKIDGHSTHVHKFSSRPQLTMPSRAQAAFSAIPWLYPNKKTRCKIQKKYWDCKSSLTSRIFVICDLRTHMQRNKHSPLLLSQLVCNLFNYIQSRSLNSLRFIYFSWSCKSELNHQEEVICNSIV